MFERKEREIQMTADVDPVVNRKIKKVSEEIGVQKGRIIKDAVKAWLEGKVDV